MNDNIEYEIHEIDSEDSSSEQAFPERLQRSHAEALNALSVTIDWVLQNNRSSMDIEVLERLKMDATIMHSKSRLNQTKISDFFKT